MGPIAVVNLHQSHGRRSHQIRQAERLSFGAQCSGAFEDRSTIQDPWSDVDFSSNSTIYTAKRCRSRAFPSSPSSTAVDVDVGSHVRIHDLYIWKVLTNFDNHAVVVQDIPRGLHHGNSHRSWSWGSPVCQSEDQQRVGERCTWSLNRILIILLNT